jgi:hypothetical protein
MAAGRRFLIFGGALTFASFFAFLIDSGKVSGFWGGEIWHGLAGFVPLRHIDSVFLTAQITQVRARFPRSVADLSYSLAIDPKKGPKSAEVDLISSFEDSEKRGNSVQVGDGNRAFVLS